MSTKVSITGYNPCDIHEYAVKWQLSDNLESWLNEEEEYMYGWIRLSDPRGAIEIVRKAMGKDRLDEIEGKIRNVIDQDGFIYEDGWETMTMDLDEAIDEMNKDKMTHVFLVEGYNMDWRGSSGRALAHIYRVDELLRLLPDTDMTIQATGERNDKGELISMDLTVWHHDCPTGSSYSFTNLETSVRENMDRQQMIRYLAGEYEDEYKEWVPDNELETVIEAFVNYKEEEAQ